MSHSSTGVGFAHMLPGYGSIVSKYDRPRRNLGPTDHDVVRQEAKRLWSSHYDTYSIPSLPPALGVTTYKRHYSAKTNRNLANRFVWEKERLNKPHPHEAFLRTHLHKIPGFYDGDKACISTVPGFIDASQVPVGTLPYKVDGSGEIGLAERIKRQNLREKAVGTHDEKKLKAFYKNEPLYRTLDGETAQATEAWLRVADEEDEAVIQEMLEFVNKKEATGRMVDSLAKPRAQDKIKEWLKEADKEKTNVAHRLFAALESGNLVERRSTSRAFRYSPNRYVYDMSKAKLIPREYKIHPEWIP